MSRLAVHLEKQSVSLLHRWAEGRSESVLHAEIQQTLTGLIAALRAGPGGVRDRAPREACDFAVEAVISGYGALRGHVLDALEQVEGDALTAGELRVVTDYFADATVLAVREHIARQVQVERARQEAARRAVQAERDRQDSLFMQAPVAIAILEGPKHVFGFANLAYRALVHDRDVVGKPLREALSDIAGKGFEVLLDRVIATGEPYFGKELPIRLAHHRGDEALILNFVYTPKRNADGEIDGVLMTGWDVTEPVEARQRVEALAAEVRASEAQLRLVTDALPMLVSFVTADERYGLVNKAYEDWFGIPREQLLGRTLVEIVGEAAYARLRPYVLRGLAGERLSFEQHQVPYRFGGARDVRVTFVPHHSGAAVDGYVALLEDITPQRRLEDEREQLAHQRTEVLESMGDAFFALDREWRVVLVNHNQERAFQRGREDILGRGFWELFPAAPDSLQFREYHRCMEERVEVRFVEHAAQDLWIDVRAYPTADGGIAVFSRDVSAEQRAEEALRRQAGFEQQLIGIVSHDLRNPLTVIDLAAKVLARREGLGERAARDVLRIEHAAGRATRLVRDLLDFTQARLGGGIHVEPRPTDVHALVRSVRDEVEASFPGRRVELSQQGDGQGTWDPDRLAQALQNLVSNALKYSPADTGVQVVTRADATTVTIAVHNLGAPIPADKLPIVFEPFQRAAEQVDRASRSVGLGLYIVKQLVEAHRGTVTVTSSERDGTTFVVTLPR